MTLSKIDDQIPVFRPILKMSYGSLKWFIILVVRYDPAAWPGHSSYLVDICWHTCTCFTRPTRYFTYCYII